MLRSLFVRSVTVVAGLGFGAGMACGAQTFAASTGTEAVITATPTSGAAKVNVPGHRRHAEETQLFGRVRDGVYTVDGMIAKVKLNYDVNGVSFLYLFAPGLGTAVVSAAPEPDAVVTEATLRESELSFTVGEHRFDLTGVALASNKGVAPAHLYVRLDRGAWRLGRQPMMGFGNVAAIPYQWPGALPSAAGESAEEEKEVLPPVPAVLLPSTSAVVPRAVAPAAVEPASLHPVSMQ